MRVVLDTNIYISAFLFAGKARKVLELLIENRIGAFISDEILNEIKQVLNREKFGLDKEHVDAIITEIAGITHKVYPDESIRHVCRDSADHIILECAVKSKADFIITGDHDLLVLQDFLGTHIISPAPFLEKN